MKARKSPPFAITTRPLLGSLVGRGWSAAALPHAGSNRHPKRPTRCWAPWARFTCRPKVSMKDLPTPGRAGRCRSGTDLPVAGTQLCRSQTAATRRDIGSRRVDSIKREWARRTTRGAVPGPHWKQGEGFAPLLMEALVHGSPARPSPNKVAASGFRRIRSARTPDRAESGMPRLHPQRPGLFGLADQQSNKASNGRLRPHRHRSPLPTLAHT